MGDRFATLVRVASPEQEKVGESLVAQIKQSEQSVYTLRGDLKTIRWYKG